MVLFIEEQTQISDFIFDINNSKFPIIIPIWKFSNIHTKQNIISFWYFRSDSKEYILGNTHPDIIPANINFTVFVKLFTPQKKELLDAIDISGIELFKYNNITDITLYYTNWQKTRDASIIPIMKWIEVLSPYSKVLHNRLIDCYPEIEQDKGFQFLNNITIPILKKIEDSGLYIDAKEFEKHYYKTSENIVFSSYNPYTTTGRPSNTYNKVNFAAIPKNTGARKSFIKQYDSGTLVLLDFESFHLRLIAKQIGLTLDFNTSVHEQLGKQYFNTDIITSEQYTQSKEKTFAALYNQYREKTPIKFFQRIYKFIDALWEYANEIGYIETPEGRKIYLNRIIDISSEKIKAKLFNYYVQALETEESMRAIQRLFNTDFDDISVVPILYTYDSFLFQVSDIIVVERMKKILENNEFPVRVYQGENYQDLLFIDI